MRKIYNQSKSFLLIILPLLFILSASETVADVKSATGREKQTQQPITQQAEIVFNSHCHVQIIPEEGFQLHVPLDSNGNMELHNTYSTGRVRFHVPDAKCGEVTITKVTSSK